MRIQENISIEVGTTYFTLDQLRELAAKFVEEAGGPVAAARRLSETGRPVYHQHFSQAFNPNEPPRPGLLVRVVQELNPDRSVDITVEEVFEVTARSRRGRRPGVGNPDEPDQG